MAIPISNPRFTTPQATVAVLAVPLLLIFVFAPLPLLERPIVAASLNFAHFFLASVACWFLWCRLRWAGWASFAAVVALAAFCEILQNYTGRCPAANDFLRGLLGASVVLIWLPAWRPTVTIAHRIGASLAVVLLSAWPVTEFLLATARFCIGLG